LKVCYRAHLAPKAAKPVLHELQFLRAVVDEHDIALAELTALERVTFPFGGHVDLNAGAVSVDGHKKVEQARLQCRARRRNSDERVILGM
jgi:hypothetical protein